MQEDNETNHTANSTEDFRVAESITSLNPTEHAFYFLKKRLKGKTLLKKTKEAEVNAWKE